MKFINIVLSVFILTLAVSAQMPDDVLATATGHTFRLRDLSPETQQWAAGLPSKIKTTRTELIDQMMSQRVLDAEALSRGISVGKMFTVEKAKIPNPTEAEIKAFFDQKQDVLAGQTLDAVRKPIIDYLRGVAEQKMIIDFLTQLKTKYKFAAGKDVNAVLAPTEVVATVNGKAVTAGEFEGYAKFELYNLRAALGDQITRDLTATIYNALCQDEARSLGIDPGALIASEITNKMTNFSDEEQSVLIDAFRKRLYVKYQVKILYKEPERLAQRISAIGAPATGPRLAPVTIVMFSDFQCSACSATHPILKKAMAAYPGKIRFVVRDFPLENIHMNAWRAALAAGAANAQGKFFEYTEILYTHQDALDDESLKKYAAELGLNAKQFELDFNSEKTAAEVRKDMADGNSYGINGTPTIYVNGVKMRDLSLDGMRSAIDKALGK